MQLFITFGHPLDDERLSINDIKELELHCVNEKNNLEIIRIPIGQNIGGLVTVGMNIIMNAEKVPNRMKKLNIK
jgi:hypothetical protein